MLFHWWDWRIGKLDDMNKRLDMLLCELLDEVSSAGGKGSHTVQMQARMAYQLWSKEYFKGNIVDEFEQYFRKLDKPNNERAGCRIRWMRDYFQDLPTDVRAPFEAAAEAEKERSKGEPKGEGMSKSVEEVAIELGGAECMNGGCKEKDVVGKGENRAEISEGPQMSPEEVLWWVHC